jgi:hypothetical protein
MADIFESTPIIISVLIALGLVGVFVYERTRVRQETESTD